MKKFLGAKALDSQESSAPGSESSIDKNLRVALSRLNMSITEVDQKIHELVTQHSTDFLTSIGQVTTLHSTMQGIHRSLALLDHRAQLYVGEADPQSTQVDS